MAYKNEITSPDRLDLTKLYSYAGYFWWKFTKRVELIRGCPFPGRRLTTS